MICIYTVHEWIKKMKEKPFPFNIQFYLKESSFFLAMFSVFFASQNLSAIFLSECCASVWSQKVVVLMRNMALQNYFFLLLFLFIYQKNTDITPSLTWQFTMKLHKSLQHKSLHMVFIISECSKREVQVTDVFQGQVHLYCIVFLLQHCCIKLNCI